MREANSRPGLAALWAWPLWLISATSLLTFGIAAFFTLATLELEEGGELDPPGHP